MGKRRMLAADENLANRISKVARARGETVYHYLNTILERALEIEAEHGRHPAKALEEYRTYASLLSTGMILVPQDLLASLVSSVDGDEDYWRMAGRRIARILKVRGYMDVERIIEAWLRGLSEISKVRDPEDGSLKIVCTASYPRDLLLERYGIMLREIVRVLKPRVSVEVSRGLVVINVPEEG